MTDIAALPGAEASELLGNEWQGIPGSMIQPPATVNADIVEQKMAENKGGYNAIGFGSTNARVYDGLTTSHAIDLVRYRSSLLHGAGRVDQFGRRFRNLWKREWRSSMPPRTHTWTGR